jgi:hypothetical protein
MSASIRARSGCVVGRPQSGQNAGGRSRHDGRYLRHASQNITATAVRTMPARSTQESTLATSAAELNRCAVGAQGTRPRYCHAAQAAYTDRTVSAARITTTTTTAFSGLVVVRAG